MSVGSFPTAGKGTGWFYALNLRDPGLRLVHQQHA